MSDPNEGGDASSQPPKLPEDLERRLFEELRKSERKPAGYFLGMKASAMTYIALFLFAISIVLFLWDFLTGRKNPYLSYLYIFTSCSAFILWLEDRRRYKDDWD